MRLLLCEPAARIYLLPSEPLPPGKVGHQMGGNYQVERRGFARRGRRVQRQFAAVDNDRVARGATRAQLTVRRPRKPLQRTLTLVWREEIIGWTKGGGRLSSGCYHDHHRVQFMTLQRHDGIFILSLETF